MGPGHRSCHTRGRFPRLSRALKPARRRAETGGGPLLSLGLGTVAEEGIDLGHRFPLALSEHMAIAVHGYPRSPKLTPTQMLRSDTR